MPVDERKLAGLQIQLMVPDPDTNEPQLYNFPILLIWTVYRVLSEVGGRDSVIGLAMLGAMITHQHANPAADQDSPHVVDVPPDLQRRVLFTIDGLWILLKRLYPTQDDFLHYTGYLALKSGYFSRADAAELASRMVGKQIESEAWRKRVNAYAKAHGLEPLALPKGRPKKPE